MDAKCRAIANALKEGRWLYLEYDSKKEDHTTFFWAAIKDVDPNKKALKVDIFNSSKSMDAMTDVTIRFDRIISAIDLTFTTYEVPAGLREKIEKNPEAFEFLHYENFNNNVLEYFKECNVLDNDPFQKNYKMVEGIDYELLTKNKSFSLNKEQENEIIHMIYVNDPNYSKQTRSMYELALSLLSIDIGKKKFVIAYQNVGFNPAEKTLCLVGQTKFNSTFMIETPHSLSRYYDGTVEDFKFEFESDKQALVAKLKDNIANFPFPTKEEVDTRPDLMILQRDIPVDLGTLYDAIEEKQQSGELQPPLKAFFGDMTRRGGKRIEPEIVTYSRPDVKQLSVIYNAMCKPVTYVQGPPGTGKTNTIFNLLISLFFAERKALVTSYNNKPVDALAEKLESIADYKGKKTRFPYLRLGNKEINGIAAKKIASLANFETKDQPKSDMLSSIKKEIFTHSGGLLELLERYEKKDSAEHALFEARQFQKMMGRNKRINREMDDIIANLKEEYDKLPSVSNEEAQNKVYIASADQHCLMYLYYASLLHIKKLKQPQYRELIQICEINDDDERAKEFTSWLRNDDNLKLLSDVFPVIFDTNISANHLGTTKFMFDMLIMDEAGQCDMARSLIPLSRAKNCLLVGDPMQLRPVIVLDPVVNEKLKNKYTISETFDYIENSILSHHTRVDKISKRILLSYHYRCGKKIIQFCNAHYYNNELDTSVIKNIGEIKLFACQNTALNSKGHIALEEARGMVDYIKKYGYNDPKKTKSGVAILVAFKDQEALVNDLLEKEGITNVKACTIHSMQGAEADTVFFSPAISRRTSLKTYEWLQNNAEVMNVGVSRAKQELFVFADEGAIESLSKRSNNKTDALLSLIKYAKSQGDVTILPRSTNYASFEKSNNSEAEDEFHKTVCQALSMDRNYRIERDIHIDKVFPKDVDAQRHHQMMFDSVIYIKHFAREKPTIAFEIAGGEHYQRGRNDKIKETICNNNGVKYIMVPNADVKDYELIKSFLEISFARKPAEKKQGMEQLSLLEEVTL